MKTTFLGLDQKAYSRSLIALAVGTAFSGSFCVAADETEVKKVPERIQITGSRIKRIDMEGAAPITTISAEDLQNAGFATVGDALRNSNLNSFGSWGGGSNNGWGSQSTVQLKGSDVQHTLVLLDGTRMAKSPVLNGGAANLNTIPMAAVDRIEVLMDGASAIYGADAIAGVVNIILKKNLDGLQIGGRLDRPTQAGGDSSNFYVSGGLESSKGNVVFSFEHYEKQVILNSERWYTSPFVVEGGDPNDIQDWVNISPTGRVLKQGAAGGWMWEHPFANESDCASVYGDKFVGVLEDSDYPGDTLCGYDYTKASAISTSQKRDNALVNYNYQINDSLKFVARTYWAKNETMDISAPVPASIKVPNGLPAYTTDEGIELKELKADPDAGIGYRFDTAGQRLAEHHDTVFDYLVGLEGEEDNFNWNVSYTYNKYTNFTWGTGYLLDGAQNDLVGSWDEETNRFVGWDPRDPNSELPLGAAANYDKRMVSTQREVQAGIGFDLFELAGGSVGFYFNASYREEALDSKVDALAEAGLILGGNGGSGGAGDRDISALSFETVLPVLDNLELNLAGRYDDYSDFGSTFNPQIAVRYNPIEEVVVRASFGTGFRAPTLSDLYKGTTEGFISLINYPLCQSKGEDIDSCTTKETAPVRSGGNLKLGPEESESVNLGLVWDISDNFDVSVDYWRLDTENLIDNIDNDELLKAQAKLNQAAAGQSVSSVYPNTHVAILPNGRIDYLINTTVNIGQSEREGLDIKFNTNHETDFGSFKSGFAISKMLKYKWTEIDGGVRSLTDNQGGTEGLPDLRINASLDYSIDAHSLNYFANYIDSQITDVYVDNSDSVFFEVGSVIYHNLKYSYNTPWNSVINVGVTNLTNEEPRFNKSGNYDRDLYDTRGRTYYVSFKQSF
ncbi:TonB-dependent receptor [Pseudoalteromonas sp. JBTF-M23]|uniref:TonB-dependent receptor n=1 Tax=Pseudoalteromonas caenipelagi TaxID=2726988 RepID=A0A849V6K1_9GAMM|nr:TonB-dependent receptor [Pseudoalteromonas caenipelagi]NOU49139.1 TonB-dependent receptor [Pseudoalteromonas caenipelagi]